MVRYGQKNEFPTLPLSVRRQTFSSKCAGSLTTAITLHHLLPKGLERKIERTSDTKPLASMYPHRLNDPTSYGHRIPHIASGNIP
jgi:hypothetical protein